MRSIDLGVVLVIAGCCLAMLGTDGLEGGADFGGVDLALSCSIRSRMDFARSAASLSRPVAGTDEKLRPSASGAGGLRCENSSIGLGLAFGVVGDCLTIDGVDGLVGTTSFGVDGFVGVVLVVGAAVLGVDCSRNRDNSRRWASILGSTRGDGDEGLGFDAVGFGALSRSRISAKRRKTSFALWVVDGDRVGGLTRGDVFCGFSVIVGVVGCGLTRIGFDVGDA